MPKTFADLHIQEITKLKTKFEDLTHFVRTARNAVDQQRNVPIDQLGMSAAKLCEMVEKAPPPVAIEIKPLMAELIEELDHLAMGLERQKMQAS